MKNTTAVILIATVSLIGLSIVQFRWLTDSVRLNRNILYQQADLATKAVGEKVRATDLAFRLIEELPNDIPTPARQEITTLIDSVLREHNITAPYTYGLYAYEHDDDRQYHWVSGTVTDRMTLDPSCEPQARQFGWTNLICGQPGGMRSHFLGVFFPHSDLYLLSTMKGTWLTTLLFIGLLIICFAYTITTIRKQKKLSDMKNDFINNLTHEFKTPIFSIDLAAGMLRKAPELQPSDRLLKLAEVIGSEGKRLRNQVDKVLQVALVDSNNFHLEKKALNIHELIQKVVDNFTLRVGERGGSIQLHLQARKHQLYADETHINNVLYNLLDNAQKYSPSAPHIVVTTQDSPDGLQISVQDNGIGIDRPTQQYIFDKFYRGTTADLYEVKGFGLGLSYVKSIIDAHQATIDLTSTPQNGSIFTLTFSV